MRTRLVRGVLHSRPSPGRTLGQVLGATPTLSLAKNMHLQTAFPFLKKIPIALVLIVSHFATFPSKFICIVFFRSCKKMYAHLHSRSTPSLLPMLFTSLPKSHLAFPHLTKIIQSIGKTYQAPGPTFGQILAAPACPSHITPLFLTDKPPQKITLFL